MPFLATQAWMMAVGAVVLHAAVLVVPGQSFAAATWTPSALVALAYLRGRRRRWLPAVLHVVG